MKKKEIFFPLLEKEGCTTKKHRLVFFYFSRFLKLYKDAVSTSFAATTKMVQYVCVLWCVPKFPVTTGAKKTMAVQNGDLNIVGQRKIKNKWES